MGRVSSAASFVVPTATPAFSFEPRKPRSSDSGAAPGRDGGWSRLAFFLGKVQAIDDGRFRPAGQALKIGDDRVDFFLSQAPALCFFP